MHHSAQENGHLLASETQGGTPVAFLKLLQKAQNDFKEAHLAMPGSDGMGQDMKGQKNKARRSGKGVAMGDDILNCFCTTKTTTTMVNHVSRALFVSAREGSAIIEREGHRGARMD